MEYASYGPPRVENLIVYAKGPVRDFETRKKKWEEKLEALWKETGYALRPEAHIASKREIEKNNAWDAYIGAYNAAVVAQRNAGKAYVVLTWDADILGTGKDPEVIERLLDPNSSSDRVRLKGVVGGKAQSPSPGYSKGLLVHISTDEPKLKASLNLSSQGLRTKTL
ncbi:MAG: hypothetical protein IIY58_05130 [Aeriscardovia sp.]|nr:hypothetical protein [Aeriscardovia sp.]